MGRGCLARPAPLARALGCALALGLAGWAAAAAQQGAWSQGPAMPTARSEIAAAAAGGRLYVIGGLGQWGTSDAVEAYDPAAGRWQRRAPLPEALHHAAAAAVGGRVYVTGGYGGLTFRLDRRATYAYDPERDAWRRLADMPAPRAAHAMVAIDDQLYVVGGAGPDAHRLWVYDPRGDRWDASRAPLPTPREHLAAALLEGKLYVLGGRGHGHGNRAVVELYDPASDAWWRAPDMPEARGGFTAAALGGRIHVTGGEDLESRDTFAQHRVLAPASGVWSPGPALPQARHGLASAALGGRWYVVGGATRAGFMTLVSLSDALAIFTPAPSVD